MAVHISVVDDEAAMRKTLAEAITAWANVARVNVRISEYPSAKAFLFAYEEKKGCDILLADIEMDGINGVEMAERVRLEDDSIQIVFITGYPDYMSRGYDVSALHYLLKPLSEEKLSEVLDRAMKNIERKGRRLILSTDEGDWATTLDSILYTESSLHNIRIYACDGMREVRMTLSEFRMMLGNSQEFRVAVRIPAVKCHDEGTEKAENADRPYLRRYPSQKATKGAVSAAAHRQAYLPLPQKRQGLFVYTPNIAARLLLRCRQPSALLLFILRPCSTVSAFV